MFSPPSPSSTDSRSSSRASSVTSVSESEECEVDIKSSSLARAEETTRRRARGYLYRGMRMDALDTKALDQLPPSMLVYPKKRHNHPKRYHFGFGVSLEQLCDYCIARDLVSNDWRGKRLYNTVMVRKAVEEISRLCGTKLYLQNVWNLDHQWILARYSNYTWHRNVMRDRDEALLTEVLQKELGICEPAKWYWQYA